MQSPFAAKCLFTSVSLQLHYADVYITYIRSTTHPPQGSLEGKYQNESFILIMCVYFSCGCRLKGLRTVRILVGGENFQCSNALVRGLIRGWHAREGLIIAQGVLSTAPGLPRFILLESRMQILLDEWP